MAQFNGKTKYKFWHSPIALFVIFCLVMLFAYNTFNLIKKERETSRNKIAELSKLNDLNSRQQNLNQEITKLDTSTGVEESIRDKYQLVKPGENMVVIIDSDNSATTHNQATVSHGFWGFIKRLFGFGK